MGFEVIRLNETAQSEWRDSRGGEKESKPQEGGEPEATRVPEPSEGTRAVINCSPVLLIDQPEGES